MRPGAKPPGIGGGVDRRADVGAADRRGGDGRRGRGPAVAGAVLLVLLVIWFVLSIFVLDVVVADAVNLATAVAWLAAAAWRAGKRKQSPASMWFAPYPSITMPVPLPHDLALAQRLDPR